MSTPPPAQTRSGRGPAIVVGVLVLVLIATGAYAVVHLRAGTSAGGDPVGPVKALPQTAMPRTDPALASYYDQKLDWASCGANQCADMAVPLDYDHPRGTTIRIALVKVPASDGHPIGSLVVNPGGPGGSGIQYAEAGAAAFTEPVASHYDLVGFDPRGVDASTRLKCLGTAQMDAYLAQDPDPETAAERTAYASSITAFGEACEKNSGDLVAHMSTDDVVRDLDILRQVLGEARLTYLGASYGTDIGAKYADRFPTHVGRMVLDGAVDPAQSSEQSALSQAKGFETALRAYVADCITTDGCPLGDSVEAGTARIHDFIDATEDRPLPTGTSRELTKGLALTGVIEALYSRQLWPVLTRGLSDAIDKGDGSLLLALSDQYAERGPDGYTGNLLSVLQAVTCLDDDESIPVSQVPQHFAEFEKASPTFGETFAFNLASCHTWPVHSGARPERVRAKGAPPIVVIGTTRDPATPYAQAVSLSEQLASGVLVSRDGDGHTGFNQGNTCVDTAVQRYLLAGTVPERGMRC